MSEATAERESAAEIPSTARELGVVGQASEPRGETAKELKANWRKRFGDEPNVAA